jgi:hypothetical protein
MEWKTKKPVMAFLENHRERIIFALLPRECEDGVTRWLCPVRILEQLSRCATYEPNTELRWIEIACYRAEVEK